MSIDTFNVLTPDEFEEVYKKWSETRNADYKNSWDQTRFISYQIYLANPNIKSKKLLTQFMPFPWDKQKSTKPQKVKDPERFERLKREYGEKI